jgi:hypothetical protein
VILELAEHALCHTSGHAKTQRFPCLPDEIEREIILLTRVKSRLETLQPVLDDRQEVVIEDTCDRTFDASWAVLELQLDDV